MVLPIGDAPNEQRVPVVTYLLIAANVAVFALVTLPLGAVRPDAGDPALLEYLRIMAEALGPRVPLPQLLEQVSAYDLFVFTHGFRPAAASAQALVVSMFLHAGLAHLVGNMLFLWIYGDNVEHRLGRLGFLLAYLATGVAATLFHAAGNMHSQIPMVGASGAISGVLGFYFVWFPHNHVRLLALLPPFLMDVFEVPARLVLGFYLVADNLLPYLIDQSPTGVAHGAHIGGFVAGLAAAWVLDRQAMTGRPGWFRQDDTPPPRDAAEVRRLLAAGRLDQAAAAYFALPAHAARRLIEPSDALDLARWLRRERHADAALVVLQRCLRDFPSAAGAAAAHALAGVLLLEDLGQPASAYQHFLDALDLGPDAETEAVLRQGLAIVAARQKRNVGHLRRRRG